MSAAEQLVLAPETESPHSGEAFELEVLAADGAGDVDESFGGEAALQPSAGMVSPAKIGPFKAGLWRGKVTLTGPGATHLRISSLGGGKASGDLLFKVRDDKPAAKPPFNAACPGCGLTLEIQAPDVYRCHRCGEIYFVDRWAHSISLKPRPPEELLDAAATSRVSLSFPADVNLLRAVRTFLVAVLNENGYQQEMINDLEIAADEAVTNVVEHAYGYDNGKTVFVELRLDKSGVQVKVKDHGPAFDPLQGEVVNLDQHIAARRRGGLGLHLMQSLMDRLEYRREDGFNVLTLTKHGEPR
ncbi:MAG TPA: ATP-binding protein [bacterium]|jgi:serine/threonine-protein kinase RsbW|nr:ATP-binding protein [bacterium]